MPLKERKWRLKSCLSISQGLPSEELDKAKHYILITLSAEAVVGVKEFLQHNGLEMHKFLLRETNLFVLKAPIETENFRRMDLNLMLPPRITSLPLTYRQNGIGDAEIENLMRDEWDEIAYTNILLCPPTPCCTKVDHEYEGRAEIYLRKGQGNLQLDVICIPTRVWFWLKEKNGVSVNEVLLESPLINTNLPHLTAGHMVGITVHNLLVEKLQRR